MSVEKLSTLKMASEQSFGSRSAASNTLREYTNIVEQKTNRFPAMLTDLRDKKSPAEEAAGRIFKTQA